MGGGEQAEREEGTHRKNINRPAMRESAQRGTRRSPLALSTGRERKKTAGRSAEAVWGSATHQQIEGAVRVVWLSGRFTEKTKNRTATDKASLLEE